MNLNKLTLSWQRSLSYRNQSTDLLWKSMGWFLYDRDLRQKGVNCKTYYFCYCLFVSGTEHILKITILFRKLLKITDLQHYDNDDTMELSSNSRVLLLPYIKKLSEILIIKPTQFLISCAIFVNWNFQDRIYIFSNYFDKLSFYISI